MYNKVIMIGHLTRDIELRYLSSGTALGKSSIATNHSYKTAQGEKKDETCFLEFDVFGKSAEIINQYVKKGNKVLLEGRLVLQQWTAQDGSKRSKHSLNVESFKFMDNKGENQGGQNSYNNQPKATTPTPVPQSTPQPVKDVDISNDEIPF
jgi:single-strand DNA-binding protein